MKLMGGRSTRRFPPPPCRPDMFEIRGCRRCRKSQRNKKEYWNGRGPRNDESGVEVEACLGKRSMLGVGGSVVLQFWLVMLTCCPLLIITPPKFHHTTTTTPHRTPQPTSTNPITTDISAPLTRTNRVGRRSYHFSARIKLHVRSAPSVSKLPP